MAADLGGSQISALLESVPGIVNVLRSPVADALVNTIRAAAELRPFALQDAEELVQYAVRRGLIGAAEGDQVLADVRGAGKGGHPRGEKSAAKPKPRKPVKSQAPGKGAPAAKPARAAHTKKVGSKKVVKKKAAKRR